MSSRRALSGTAFATLLLIALMMGANHVAARLAFNHGVDVATAVVFRSAVTAVVVGTLANPATDNAWQAKHAKALEAERAETAKETKRADQAAANYLTEHLDQEDRYAALSATYQDLRRRVPLVVPGPVVVVTRSDPQHCGLDVLEG